MTYRGSTVKMIAPNVVQIGSIVYDFKANTMTRLEVEA